jgi:hypothetical protein
MSNFQAQRHPRAKGLSRGTECPPRRRQPNVRALAAPIGSRKEDNGAADACAKLASEGLLPRKRLVATASPPTTTVSECLSLCDPDRNNPDWISDLQQTGLRRSEGMSEDERALTGLSLVGRAGFGSFLEVHSQRQLVFCQNFSLRVVFYHREIAAPPVP